MMSGVNSIRSATQAFAIIAVLLAFGPSAHAQQQPTPAALASAKELVTVIGADKLFEPLIAGVVEQGKNLYLQQNPGLAKDLNDSAVTIRTELAPRSVEILNEVARLFATHFTEQEIKDLLVFFKSPVGKKYLDQQPLIVQQTETFAQGWANKLSDEVLAKIRIEMKKKGHDL
jgi:uncharacterized protein